MDEDQREILLFERPCAIPFLPSSPRGSLAVPARVHPPGRLWEIPAHLNISHAGFGPPWDRGNERAGTAALAHTRANPLAPALPGRHRPDAGQLPLRPGTGLSLLPRALRRRPGGGAQPQ